jgi:hypothetical protein
MTRVGTTIEASRAHVVGEDGPELQRDYRQLRGGDPTLSGLAPRYPGWVSKPPSWTCARCQVTASWMPGHEQAGLPPGWSNADGTVSCLACRRELAAEAGLSAAPADASVQDRAQLQKHARIEFEISRDPERTDGEIARAVRSSVPAVQRARERLLSRAGAAEA